MRRTSLFILIAYLAFSGCDTLKTRDSVKVHIGEDGIYRLIVSSAPTMSHKKVQQLAKLIHRECRKYEELDPLLVLAVIEVESGFFTRAVSPKGAIGLMQVMPGTMDYMAKRMEFLNGTSDALFDPVVNLTIGINYLGLLTERYGNIQASLIAYNYGPGRVPEVMKSKVIPAYAQKVLKAKEKIMIKHFSSQQL